MVIEIRKREPSLTPDQLEEFSRLVKKEYERLAYNAAYQRDLRTIKRQGLNMTVKQYRESLK